MQNNDDNKDGENQGQKHDADAGNVDSPDELSYMENLIDPGNEHRHSGPATTGSSLDKDAGTDATATTGPEPGEGKNDTPDVSGEDG